MSEQIEVSIKYPGGCTDNAALVTPLGKNTYRLELEPWSFLWAEDEEQLKLLPNYGDIIEAIALNETELQFTKVIERARLKRFEFLLSKNQMETSQMEAILSNVKSIGGYWENVLGGCC